MYPSNTALILVDVQNDFLPGGALAVPQGNEIIYFIDTILRDYKTIIATKDWHPHNHISFAVMHEGHNIGDTISIDNFTQILWPEHCVQNTFGAEICKKIDTNTITHTVNKGINQKIDSYSGFFDNQRKQATKLHTVLQEEGIKNVHICGLATDYCVKYTALDAVELGYKTYVLLSGCKAVNMNPEDEQHAIEEMRAKGVVIAYDRV